MMTVNLYDRNACFFDDHAIILCVEQDLLEACMSKDYQIRPTFAVLSENLLRLMGGNPKFFAGLHKDKILR